MTTTTEPTAAEILAIPMRPDNDAGVSTVGGFLVALLRTLWEQDEGFSGKRPFGNSGWQYDVYESLVRAGLVEGVLDEEEGYLDEISPEQIRRADALIQRAIGGLLPT